MDLSELQQRIDVWEDVRTEFKAWPIPTDRLAATLVAFANAEGGDLIVGVDDAGELLGVDDADAVSGTALHFRRPDRDSHAGSAAEHD